MTSCSYCGQTQPTPHPCHACSSADDDATRLVEKFGEDDETEAPSPVRDWSGMHVGWAYPMGTFASASAVAADSDRQASRKALVDAFAEEDRRHKVSATPAGYCKDFGLIDGFMADIGFDPVPRPTGWLACGYEFERSHFGTAGSVSIFCADGLTREYTATPGQPWKMMGEHP